MPAADYNFAPFGSGAADAVRSGDGAHTFGQLMQHIGQAEGFYLGRFGYLACSVETQSELVVLVRDRDGHILGQIDIDSHTRNAFSRSLESAVKQIAQDLGDFWPRGPAHP